MSTFEKVCIVAIILLGLVAIIAGVYFLGVNWTSKTSNIAGNKELTNSKNDNIKTGGQETIKDSPTRNTDNNTLPKVNNHQPIDATSKLCRLKGTVKEKATDKSISGAEIFLSFTDETGNYNYRSYSQTDGGFLIDNIHEGQNYYITVSKEGFATNIKDQVNVKDATDIGAIYLEVGTEAELNAVDATSGIPIEGAEVTIKQQIRLYGRTVGMTVVKGNIFTNSNGKAILPNLSDGIYYLDIKKTGYANINNYNLKITGGKPEKVSHRVPMRRNN